jgi:hypothetical protein
MGMKVTTITEAVEAYFQRTGIYHNEGRVLTGEVSGWTQIADAKEVYFTCTLVNGKPTDIKAHPNKRRPKPSNKVLIA